MRRGLDEALQHAKAAIQAGESLTGPVNERLTCLALLGG